MYTHTHTHAHTHTHTRVCAHTHAHMRAQKIKAGDWYLSVLYMGVKWKKLVAKSSVVPQRPLRLRDRWWRWRHMGLTDFEYSAGKAYFCPLQTRYCALLESAFLYSAGKMYWSMLCCVYLSCSAGKGYSLYPSFWKGYLSFSARKVISCILQEMCKFYILPERCSFCILLKRYFLYFAEKVLFVLCWKSVPWILCRKGVLLNAVRKAYFSYSV